MTGPKWVPHDHKPPEVPELTEDPPVDPKKIDPDVNISNPQEKDPEPGGPDDDFYPLKFESRYVGCEMHLVPKIPPAYYCYARRFLRTKHPKRGYIDLFTGFCRMRAGQHTEHTGEGRCKHHGGNLQGSPMRPEGEPHAQKNISTFAHVDPHHFVQSLPKEQQGHLKAARTAILNRIADRHGKEPDFLDAKLAHRIAVEFHIVAKASEHVENTSGLTQTIFNEEGKKQEEKKAALLDDIRKRDKDIISMLKDLGVLDDPETQKADALKDWAKFVESTRDEVIDV